MSIARISWNGWPECLQIQNGIIEAVIVPCIGRVMQLRLLDDPVGASGGILRSMGKFYVT